MGSVHRAINQLRRKFCCCKKCAGKLEAVERTQCLTVARWPIRRRGDGYYIVDDTDRGEVSLYPREYVDTLHLLRLRYEVNESRLKAQAEGLKATATEVVKNVDRHCEVSVEVAALDHFRLRFKEAFGAPDLKHGSPTAQQHRLIRDPFSQLAELIHIQLDQLDEGSIRNVLSRLASAVNATFDADGDDTWILRLGHEITLGTEPHHIPVGVLRVWTNSAKKPSLDGKWKTISLEGAEALMVQYYRDSAFARELHAKPISKESFFELACCLFAGTCVDYKVGMGQSALKLHASEVYATDLWVSHAMEALNAMGWTTIAQVRTAAVAGWPAALEYKKDQESGQSDAYNRAHVTGDLIKSLIFGSAEFRARHPIKPQTEVRIRDWFKSRRSTA